MKFMYVYILECSDGTYYTGVTNNIERRLNEHQSGCIRDSYTYNRRPVKLVYHEIFNDPSYAITYEKKLKKWSQTKKKALIDGDFDKLIVLSKKKFKSGLDTSRQKTCRGTRPDSN
jgi:putative endonuclease